MTDKKERSTGDIIKETENQSCPVHKAAYYIDAFLKELMCGKCFPCALGTYEAALILRDVISGNTSNADIGKLGHIADIMILSSRCKKGRDTQRVMEEAIKDAPYDFSITEGLRSLERQKQLFADKKSSTMTSRHLTGHAVDVCIIIEGKLDGTWTSTKNWLRMCRRLLKL